MKTHNALFMALATKAKLSITELDAEEVKKIENAVMIDVRELSEWQTGHLPNAIHLSKGILERDIEKVIPDVNTPLVLYCSGGYRSAIAAESLQKMGYKNAASLKNGLAAWLNAGYLLVE